MKLVIKHRKSSLSTWKQTGPPTIVLVGVILREIDAGAQVRTSYEMPPAFKTVPHCPPVQI